MFVERGSSPREAMVLVGMVLALAVFVAGGCRTVPGKEAPPSVDADRLTGLLDEETALAVVEWAPGPPAEEGEDVTDREEACGVVAAAALGFLGIDVAADGGEDADPAASQLADSFSRVTRLLAERRLFLGSVFYGAMTAAPLEGMDWPSAADVLVARTTPAGTEALAGLLDALARRFPERVRVLEEPAADGAREWALEVPSWKGEARIRLSGNGLRATFGGGSLAGERDRLMAGTPSVRPLAGVLPAPLETASRGVRYWVRPSALAGYAGAWMDDVFRMAADEGKGQPQEMLLRTFGKQFSPWVERVVGSFVALRGRSQGGRGWHEYRLAEDADPVVRLWHDAEGTLRPELFGGVPGDVAVRAFAMPSLDRLAAALGEALSPDAAGLAKMFLATPIDGGTGPSWGQALAAFGPGVVAWEEPGQDRAGFAVELADDEVAAATIRMAAKMNDGGDPEEEEGTLLWRLPDRTILLGHGLLVSSGDEATARRVLARKGGLGDDPSFRAALERLAEGRPVHLVTWNPAARHPEPELPDEAGEEDVRAFVEALGRSLATCFAPGTDLPPGTRGVLGVGTTVPDGGRAMSVPVGRDGGGR